MDAFDRHEPDFGVLHRVSEHVYTFLTEFLFMGKAPINNRGVVVHVPDAPGGPVLAIINPAQLSPALEESIHRLARATDAPVRYLISPGDWHYLFMGEHLTAFPGARAFVPPGRIPGMKPVFSYELIDVEAENPFPELSSQVQAMTCQGLADIMDPDKQRPRHELVFYFPEIRAITSGDVFYYNGVDELSPMQKAIGQRARVLDFHFAKWKMVRDPAAFQRSVERVLAWDFDRYISIHGQPGNMLESGARAGMEEVLAWIKAPPQG